MQEDEFWNRFTGTGSVEDYLAYLSVKDKKDDDNRGDSPERTERG